MFGNFPAVIFTLSHPLPPAHSGQWTRQDKRESLVVLTVPHRRRLRSSCYLFPRCSFSPPRHHFITVLQRYNCAPTPLLAWQQDHRGCWGKDYGSRARDPFYLNGEVLDCVQIYVDHSVFKHLSLKKKLRSTDQLAMISFLFIVCKMINIFSVPSETPLKKCPFYLGIAKIAFASDVHLHYIWRV